MFKMQCLTLDAIVIRLVLHASLRSPLVLLVISSTMVLPSATLAIFAATEECRTLVSVANTPVVRAVVVAEKEIRKRVPLATTAVRRTLVRVVHSKMVTLVKVVLLPTLKVVVHA